MSKPPPVGGFEWITDFDNWRSTPCILKVDLEYWKELHDDHYKYPLAPRRLMMNGVEKLVPKLYDKERYIVHYKNFKQCLVLGLKIQGKKFQRKPLVEETYWAAKPNFKHCTMFDLNLITVHTKKTKLVFKRQYISEWVSWYQQESDVWFPIQLHQTEIRRLRKASPHRNWQSLLWDQNWRLLQGYKRWF